MPSYYENGAVLKDSFFWETALFGAECIAERGHLTFRIPVQKLEMLAVDTG
jgi:hypothetical protein